MRETAKHLDAFEKYYDQEPPRSLALLASDLGVTPKTTKTWSSAFNWQDRVAERDKQIAAEMEAEIIKRHKQFKLEQYEQMLKDIADVDRMKNYQKAVYNTSIGKDGKPVVKIETIRDMKDTVQSMSSLARDKTEMIKTAQLLAGDNTENVGVDGKMSIEHIWEKVIKKDGDSV